MGYALYMVLCAMKKLSINFLFRYWTARNNLISMELNSIQIFIFFLMNRVDCQRRWIRRAFTREYDRSIVWLIEPNCGLWRHNSTLCSAHPHMLWSSEFQWDPILGGVVALRFEMDFSLLEFSFRTQHGLHVGHIIHLNFMCNGFWMLALNGNVKWPFLTHACFEWKLLAQN